MEGIVGAARSVEKGGLLLLAGGLWPVDRNTPGHQSQGDEPPFFPLRVPRARRGLSRLGTSQAGRALLSTGPETRRRIREGNKDTSVQRIGAASYSAAASALQA